MFQSLSSYDYTVAVVTDSFLDSNSTWSLQAADINRGTDPSWNDWRVDPPSINSTRDIQLMHNEALTLPYQNLSVTDCFALYDGYFEPQGNVLIFVTNDTSKVNNSLLLYVSIIPRSDDWGKNMWALSNGTGSWVALSPSTPVTTWFLGPPRYEVKYCLAQPPPDAGKICRFEYCPLIMFIVCSLNFIKVAIMLCIWVLRRWQEEERQISQKQVLYTLGDAIASFMRIPDQTTEKMCLAGRDDFLSHRTRKKPPVSQPPEPREWKDDPRRWLAAASWKRWVILLLM